MKKLLAIILLFTIILTVAACSTENPSGNSTTTTQSSTTTTTKPTTTTTQSTTADPVDLSYMVGYWYEYDIENPPPIEEVSVYIPRYPQPYGKGDLRINELYIKSVEGNKIVLDYTLDFKSKKDITVEIENGCGFYTDGGYSLMVYLNHKAIGLLTRPEECRIYLEIKEEDSSEVCKEAYGYFDYKYYSKMVEPAASTSQGNYDLTEYIGTWYRYEGASTEPGLTDRMEIKSVDGNCVTFSYHFSTMYGDIDVSVEVNNNIGYFEGNYSRGIIKFEKNSVTVASVCTKEGYDIWRMQTTFKSKE